MLNLIGKLFKLEFRVSRYTYSHRAASDGGLDG